MNIQLGVRTGIHLSGRMSLIVFNMEWLSQLTTARFNDLMYGVKSLANLCCYLSVFAGIRQYQGPQVAVLSQLRYGFSIDFQLPFAAFSHQRRVVSPIL